MVSDPRESIQNQSLNSLFKILNENGDSFSKDFWQMILSAVIKPLFDDIQYSLQSKKSMTREQIQAFRNLSEKAFVELIKLYNSYFTKLKSFTADIFSIILNCIQNPQESLAKVSVSALKFMINHCSNKFQAEEWDNISIVIQKIVSNTMPYQVKFHVFCGN